MNDLWLAQALAQVAVPEHVQELVIPHVQETARDLAQMHVQDVQERVKDADQLVRQDALGVQVRVQGHAKDVLAAPVVLDLVQEHAIQLVAEIVAEDVLDVRAAPDVEIHVPQTVLGVREHAQDRALAARATVLDHAQDAQAHVKDHAQAARGHVLDLVRDLVRAIATMHVALVAQHKRSRT